MNEHKLQKMIIDKLDEYCFNFKTIRTNKRGIPDIIGCYNGAFFAIEVKNPNGKGRISKAQKIRQQQIIKNGGHAIFCDSYNDFLDKFEEFKQRIDNEKAR